MSGFDRLDFHRIILMYHWLMEKEILIITEINPFIEFIKKHFFS